MRSLYTLATMLVVLAAAGATSAATPPTRTSARIAAEVPAKIRAKGLLTVATAATYPPNEFTGQNGRTIKGMDADLARAIAGVLGLHVRLVNVRFEKIIPGVTSRTFDAGISSITDTGARERVVDLVTYFTSGTSFYVKRNAGPHITSLKDLCGRTVAVVRGTTQEDDASAQTLACRRAGKPDVAIAPFPDYTGALIALESSSTAIGMADSPVANYIVKKARGQLQLTGTYGAAPYGIALPKHSGLAKPVSDALRELISNGTYHAILKTWTADGGAIATPQINPARG